jgi:hypothetical protein
MSNFPFPCCSCFLPLSDICYKFLSPRRITCTNSSFSLFSLSLTRFLLFKSYLSLQSSSFSYCYHFECHNILPIFSSSSTFHSLSSLYRNWGSSGSIVSDYGLDDRAIEVRSPAGAKDISSSLCVQTGYGAQPASCTMCTGGTFPGGKSAAGA